MGPLIGILLLIVVLIVGGLGSFLGLQASNQSPSTSTQSHPWSAPTTCQGPGCTIVPPTPKSVYLHDVKVTSPFSSAQAGSPITFNALLQHGTPASYLYNFGDGSPAVVSASSSIVYTYPSPGTYTVYVQVTDTAGLVHDNLLNLYPFTATSSYAGDPLGDHVETAGAVIANGTSTSNPTAVIPQGGSVTLSAYISGSPVNAATVISASQISYVAQGTASTAFTASGASGTGLNSTSPLVTTFTAATGAAAGSYAITFQAISSLAFSGGTINGWSNYTFTIQLGSATGAGVIPPVKYPSSLHQGTIQSYELVPGGANSLDPSIDYETAGAEVIYNVYETLVNYNGSQAGPNPTGFVPAAAMCVPGTVTGHTSCQSMYGSSLIAANGDYTFVLNPEAKFYDPGNGAIMNVYPTDVEWSLVRTCLFAVYPAVANNPGWIQCQALLPYNVQGLGGDPAYDNGLHTPWNNTPYNLLSSMTVNESGICTAAMMDGVHGDGCITFHTGLSGSNPWYPGSSVWPEFLELMADPNGAAIQSCKWEQTQGFNLPGWTSCGSPPAPTAVTDSAWDFAEKQGAPTNWNQNIYQSMVGSGPYYLASYSLGASYALKESPAWTGTSCQGGHADGCLPTSSQIQATYISNTWEKTETPGEAAYASGTADFATIPSTSTATMLNDISQGLIGATTSPTLSIFFSSFNMYEDAKAAQALTTVTLTAPANMMQDLNMRQFLTHTFPYGTQASQFCTTDGIQYCELYGGTIPKGMGNFYPQNISWPSGQPDQVASDAGGAAWWWNKVATDSFDGPVCTTATPCVYPLVISAGDPMDLAMYQQWAAWTQKISGGAVQAAIIQINFATLVADLYGAPGTGGFSSFFLGWLPDYPDPSDYTVPMIYPDSTYTFTSGWLEGTTGLTATGQPSGLSSGYNAACAGTNAWNYVITTQCQGWAYLQMYADAAAGDSCVLPACSVTQRQADYAAAEAIQNGLGMYVYDWQEVGVGTYALWINPACFTPNPITPGAVWYNVGYQGQPIP